MIVGGFFLLLVMVIFVLWLGRKLMPLIIPSGWRKPVLVGWVGSLAGNLLGNALWQFGPSIAEINLVAAFIGSVLFVLALGLYPFLKILLGRI